MEDSPAGSSGDHALTTALPEQVQAELGLDGTNGGVGLTGDGEDLEPGHRLGPLSLAVEERGPLLLIGEMIAATGQAQALVAGVDLGALEGDRQRRDALLWNFTVLGEAAAQHDAEVKARFPEVP